MNTIDELLHFVFLEAMASTTPFSSRDNKTLRSLQSAMQSDTYITEKQGMLLLSILSNDNYSSFMLQANATYKEYLEIPQWSKPFRVLPDVKKIYYIPANSDKLPNFSQFSNNQTGAIAIEFTFSTVIRNHIKKIGTVALQVKSGSLYMAEYTERNIVTILDHLNEFNFEVDELFQNQYNMITSWDKTSITDQYLIENMPNPYFQQMLINDIGESNLNNPLIINDRKTRYQYTTNFPIDRSSLTGIIANRDTSKIWIDNTKYTLSEIFKSLIELQRFPLLVVFDQLTDINTIAQFNSVIHGLSQNNINQNIGIYFRLDNTADGKIFNDAIAQRQYNCRLDETTQVAGVRAGKLPKFFLQSNWKPKSVISINNSLRQSKTAVYAKCCDLIISYTSIEPIIEPRKTWE